VGREKKMTRKKNPEYYEPRDWYPYLKAMELLEGKGFGGIYWIRFGKAIPYPKGKSRVIYIGKSEVNIRRRLKEHLQKRDEPGKCIMQQASVEELEVGVEVVLERSLVHQREQELLGAFQKKFGKLPECNSFRLR